MDLTQQLAQVLQERAGLDPEAADRAAQTALQFLQEQGPALAQQFLGGQGGGGGSLTDLFKR